MSPVPNGEETDKPPDNPDDSHLSHQEPLDIVINADSSDSDDDHEFGGYMGYQMLAQDLNDNNENDADDDDDEDENESEEEQHDEELEKSASGNVEPDMSSSIDNVGLAHQVRHPDFPNSPNLPGYMKVPDMPRPEKRDLLWNQPGCRDLAMDSGHVDKIRSAMSGFQLPASHIPEWAKSITEDQWKAQVMNRLVGDNSSDKQAQECDSSNKNQTLEVIAMEQTQKEAGASSEMTSSAETLSEQKSTSDIDMKASKT